MYPSIMIPLLIGGVITSGVGVSLANRCSEVSIATKLMTGIIVVGIGVTPALVVYTDHIGGIWPLVVAWGWVIATMALVPLSVVAGRGVIKHRSAAPVTAPVFLSQTSTRSIRGRSARIDAAIGALTRQLDFLSKETPPRAARRSEEPNDDAKNTHAHETATA